MAPAVGVARGWNGGSPSLRGEAVAADTATAITEHPERLQGDDSNKHHTTAAASSQAVRPVRSRYAWSGAAEASSSRSPAAAASSESGDGRKQQRSSCSGGLAAEQRRHQRRCSSFEGYVIEGEGEELGRGSTTTSTSFTTSTTSSLAPAKLDKNATAGDEAPEPRGGAPGQFFGSGYYGGSKSKQQQQQQQQHGARKVQHQAAAAAGAAPPSLAAQGHRHVDEKASRATDSVCEAWRIRGGVGNREGGQQRQTRAPAWQQQQQRQGDSVGSV
ncbi:unnamed protein product [Ectocarpus sp. 12 AP-2014]